ncbi:hypothetical protein BDZ91DRAFT_709493 [Kalaharituber pfeilii]|nr:hypothetical protein BDZ91DRAFT_709493 [Kalaharituber pfeilii]
MRLFTATFILLVLPHLTTSLSPGSPTGNALSTLPLAATLSSENVTCPGSTMECPNSPSHCCPTGLTCLKKQDILGVIGWGCCTAMAGVTCPLILSNTECAVEGWVACGDGRGATCCEKESQCRLGERGMWDCSGESQGSGEMMQNEKGEVKDEEKDSGTGGRAIRGG